MIKKIKLSFSNPYPFHNEPKNVYNLKEWKIPTLEL